MECFIVTKTYKIVIFMTGKENTEEKSMNNDIFWNQDKMPLLNSTDFWHSAKPFIHQDRIMSMHVFDYIVRGRMQIIEDGKEYVLTPGSFLFLKSGVRHWGTEFCEPDTEWYYFHFYLTQEDLYPVKNIHGDGGEVMSQEDYRYSVRLPKMMTLYDAEDISSMERMLRELVKDYHDAGKRPSGMANQALAAILNECIRCSVPEGLQSHTDEIVKKIKEYLKKHRYEQLDTAALSSEIHLNYRYAGALFKNACKKTILEYHTGLRMEEAGWMLRESPLSVSEISSRVGYSEPFYFSSVFRKCHGISPREYRKKAPEFS